MHVDGLGRNWLLLYILTDADGIGRRGCFEAWKCEVADVFGLYYVL